MHDGSERRNEVETFAVGEHVFMLNPFFSDGTRLRVEGNKHVSCTSHFLSRSDSDGHLAVLLMTRERASIPAVQAAFSDGHILNDCEVEILQLNDEGFAKVCCEEDGIVIGWVRQSNLTHVQRRTGLAKVRASSASFKRGPSKDAIRGGVSRPPPMLRRSNTISNLEAQSSGSEDEGHVLDEHNMASALGMKRLMQAGPSKADLEASRQRVHALRVHLRRKRRGTLDPNSRFMSRWDLLMGCSLVFTAVVTPFEVCVLEPTPLSAMLVSPLAWLNRLLDVAFLMDVGVNCVLAYREPAARGASWVYDRRRILCTYLRTWMAVDVLSALPFDLALASYEHAHAIEPTGADALGAHVSETSGVRALRIVRMLRLLKLVRMMRASRIIQRWQAHVGISFAALTLCWFVVLTVATAHWMACLWLLVGTSNAVPADAPVDTSGAALSTNWIHQAGLQHADAFALYGVALFSSFGLTFGIGPGPGAPCSVAEYYVQTAMMVWSPSASPPNRASFVTKRFSMVAKVYRVPDAKLTVVYLFNSQLLIP